MNGKPFVSKKYYFSTEEIIPEGGYKSQIEEKPWEKLPVCMRGKVKHKHTLVLCSVD